MSTAIPAASRSGRFEFAKNSVATALVEFPYLSASLLVDDPHVGVLAEQGFGQERFTVASHGATLFSKEHVRHTPVAEDWVVGVPGDDRAE